MTKFAATTKVPVDNSIAHIRKELKRYGADGFIHGDYGDRAMISFKWENRVVRIEIGLPGDPQGERQRYRALLLVVKSKLECIECGIETFEEAFLAHLVLPDGQTIGSKWAGGYRAMIDAGKDLPRLIGWGGGE